MKKAYQKVVDPETALLLTVILSLVYFGMMILMRGHLILVDAILPMALVMRQVVRMHRKRSQEMHYAHLRANRAINHLELD